MNDDSSVTVCDGKYTVKWGPNQLIALRYGKPWRDCCGDGLILALAQEVLELREKLAREVEVLEALRPVWAQGHTSDSVAAQANGQALAALWKMLGVDNQTDASVRLMTLIKGEKK